MSGRDYLTIGEVVQRLQPTYPELSISKLRFLEEEGLISPERTQGGYRKFTQADVSRVDMILRLQRDRFLPLAVIKDKLAEVDRGRVPVELAETQSIGAVATTSGPAVAGSGPLALEDAPAEIGVPASFIRELAGFDIVEITTTDGVASVDRGDVIAIHAAWDLRRFGVEPRHLRMYETFAARESALFSQILMPAFRHRTPDTRARLAETLNELSGLTDQLKGRLLRRSLAKAFEDYT